MKTVQIINDNIVRMVQDIDEEVSHARKKFPTNRHQLTALTEEVGELSQAMLEQHHGKKTAQDVYSEAVQVACMAMRVAIEGDADFDYNPKDVA